MLNCRMQTYTFAACCCIGEAGTHGELGKTSDVNGNVRLNLFFDISFTIVAFPSLAFSDVTFALFSI